MSVLHQSITVENIAAIDQVHVAELHSGTFLWAEAEGQSYVLYKSSTATPDGVNVIAPIQGSPVAGASGARWIRQQTNSDGAPWYVELDHDETTSSLVPVELLPLSFSKPTAGRVKISSSTTAFLTSPAGVADGPLGSIQLELDGTVIHGGAIGSYPRQAAPTDDEIFAGCWSFTPVVTTLAAGPHTVRLLWAVSFANLVFTCAASVVTDAFATLMVEEI